MKKTNKSILKRIKITKNKKLLRRKSHQNHFNAKDPGQKTGAKRSLAKIAKSNHQSFKKAISYHL